MNTVKLNRNSIMYRNLLMPTILVYFFSFLVFLPAVSGNCACVNSIFYLLRESDYQIISSPDYPRPYCPNLDCSWRLIAPDNKTKIRFYSDNIDLRLNKDYINFYNMDATHPSDEVSTITHRCTGEGKCEFTSAGQYVTIKFKSAGGLQDKYGFFGRATVYAEPTISKEMIIKFSIGAAVAVLLVVVLIAVFFICKCRRQRSERNRELRSTDPARGSLLK